MAGQLLGPVTELQPTPFAAAKHAPVITSVPASSRSVIMLSHSMVEKTGFFRKAQPGFKLFLEVLVCLGFFKSLNPS